MKLLVSWKPVRLKQVFKVKCNNNGIINKFKGRVVTQGYLQVYEIDFEEMYILTIRYDILKLLFAITIIED